MPNRMMRWFDYGHLPEHLRQTSMMCYGLASAMDDTLPEGPKRRRGCALEAKDCFVRARLESEDVA